MVEHPPAGVDEEFSEIRYQIRDRVAHVMLACPKTANALGMRMRLELVAALRRAQSDEAVSVVGLDGDGSTFCSGYDLRNWSETGHSAASQQYIQGTRVFDAIHQHPGAAVGHPLIRICRCRRRRATAHRINSGL